MEGPTLTEEIDNLELKYRSLKEDYITALNYHRIMPGFDDLKRRTQDAERMYHRRLGMRECHAEG